jgi:hypothetical protein
MREKGRKKLGGKKIFGWKPENLAWNKKWIFFFFNSKLRGKKVVVNLIHLQVGDRQTEGLDAL